MNKRRKTGPSPVTEKQAREKATAWRDHFTRSDLLRGDPDAYATELTRLYLVMRPDEFAGIEYPSGWKPPAAPPRQPTSVDDDEEVGT